jgi:hypothetical protein
MKVVKMTTDTDFLASANTTLLYVAGTVQWWKQRL